MGSYAVFLRGINVGGKNRISMTDLTAALEGIGLKDVRTYIQSGNVVFRSADGEKAAGEKLDAALGEKLGKKPGVMIRSSKEMEAIAKNAPFPDAKPSFVLVHFLPEAAPKDALDKMSAPDGEEAVVSGREIYVHYPIGSGKSKLKLSALKAGTSRNINTVRKLVEMAAALES